MFPKDVPKSRNHVYKKLLSQFWDIFYIYSPFYTILSNFIQFINSQHYAHRVTTMNTPPQSIKVTPRKWQGGRRISDDV